MHSTPARTINASEVLRNVSQPSLFPSSVLSLSVFASFLDSQCRLTALPFLHNRLALAQVRPMSQIGRCVLSLLPSGFETSRLDVHARVGFSTHPVLRVHLTTLLKSHTGVS